MGIFWCMKNNVKSCKKFYEKAQTANFSYLTKGRQELCVEKAEARLWMPDYHEVQIRTRISPFIFILVYFSASLSVKNVLVCLLEM